MCFNIWSCILRHYCDNLLGSLGMDGSVWRKSGWKTCGCCSFRVFVNLCIPLRFLLFGSRKKQATKMENYRNGSHNIDTTLTVQNNCLYNANLLLNFYLMSRAFQWSFNFMIHTKYAFDLCSICILILEITIKYDKK